MNAAVLQTPTLFETLRGQRMFVVASKLSKRPIDPNTLANSDATDSATWLTPEEAQAHVARLGTDYGVGIVLSPRAPVPLACIDIDKSLQPDNTWSPLAVQLCQRFAGAYQEVSNSAKALHIIFAYLGDFPPHAKKNTKLHLELYHDVRYILLGSNAHGTVLFNGTALAPQVIAEYFPAKSDSGDPIDWDEDELPHPEWSGPADDDALVELMLNARGSAAAMLGSKAKLSELWHADADALAKHFPPQTPGKPYNASSADQALANHLAFYCGNCRPRMERMMLRSALNRPKWERLDYFRGTISKAASGQTKFYKQRDAATPGAVPPPPNTPPGVEPWPEPENIFRALTAPAFDGSEFPPELAQFALLDARQTGFDRGIGLNAALSVASMAINDSIKVCANPATRWFEEARLWLLIIAPPGIGKTPGQKPMIAPLWTIHGRLYEAWAKEDAEWNAMPKKERPPKPPAPRVLLTDVTVARLSDVLKDNPRGIGLVVDEFSSWFGALDMQSSAGAGGHDRGEALMLFQGGPHQIERVTRGSIFVPNWSAGILTGSTPDQMRIYSKSLPEDGLLQRIVVYLAHDKSTPESSNPQLEQQLDAARQRYTQLIENLWALIPMSNGGVVHLSKEAKDYFATWCASVDQHVKAYRELIPPLAGHVAKFPTLALRIALTFHCVQIVSGPPEQHSMYDVARHLLSLATIKQATDYLARSAVHAQVMYRSLSGSNGPISIAREVANYILVHKATDNVLARRDILRHVHGYAKADENAQGDAMRFLEDMGWVRVTEGGQRRATGPTRYAVNPRIAVTFKDQAQAEEARRLVARELIGVAAAQARREAK